MSIEIQQIETDRELWERCVEQSPQTTLFHQFNALALQAEYSESTPVLLAGFKGQEPVGIVPLFTQSKGPITAALSPVPRLWIQKLGPAFLNMEKLKQRKAEKRRRRFVEGVFDWMDDELNPRIVQFTTPGGLDDVRPFKWNDCDVTPEFTYVVDLRQEPDELLQQFSSDARRNIRKTEDDAFTIDVGDEADIERIMNQVRNRYESQGKSFDLPAEFPVALSRRLPDEQIRPYVFRKDGDFYGGVLATDDGDTLGRWYGGVTPDENIDLPINDLLDWHIIRDGIDRNRSFYDLVGAGDPRINEYKAKFAPQLQVFYSVQRTSLPMQYLLKTYQRLPKL
jgi:CelD/BcsL family acetyltransferase involved in cellulose biosynthesis